MSKQIAKWGLSASAALFLVACSGMQKNDALIEAEEAYQAASQNELLLRYAPTELERARKAITSAASAQNVEDMTSQAYVAKTRLLTAQSVAERKAASARITELGSIKDDERLRARELELRLEAEAKKEALRGQDEALRSKDEALRGQDEALRSKDEALRGKDEALRTKDEALREKEAALLEREQALADAEALRLELAELQALKTERGMVMTLGDVLFSTGKTELLPGAMATITKLADFLAEYSEKTILIEGHTDSVGSESSNQGLSERRALSVKAALAEAGVDESRIDTLGLGESTPMASNDTDAGRLKNRRVEIVIRD